MIFVIKDEIPQIKAKHAIKFGNAHSVPLLSVIADKLALSADKQYLRHFRGIIVSGPTLHFCVMGLMESRNVDRAAN